MTLTRRVLLLMMAASAASVLVACGDDNGNGAKTPEPTATVERQAPAATFAESSCGFTLPEGQDASAVRCGTLTVPEDRSKDDGRTLDLAVAVLKATGGSPAADPILYLSGGPGGASLEGEMQGWSRDFAAALQESHDLVFFDQRGTGRSKPLLACPEVNDTGIQNLAENLSVEQERERTNEAFTRCHDRLAGEGVNFNAYSSAASAADIADLMPALGYGDYNIVGVSYGTRLALTVLRDHPDGVRSVVLDSTVPIQADIPVEQAANFRNVLDTMTRDCQAIAPCNAAYPDLSTRIYALVRKLNETPVTVTPNGPDGKPFTVVVNGNRLEQGAFNVFYSTSLIPIVPFAAYQIDSGNYGLLTQLAGQIPFQFSGIADGMQVAVDCAEETPFVTAEDVGNGSREVPEEIVAADIGFSNPAALKAERDRCSTFGVTALGSVEEQAVVSAVPTLVLGGEYDPITPPKYGRLAAQTLSRSSFFEFKGTGHGVIYARECGMRMAAAFIASPDAQVDGSCVGEIGPPLFQVQ